MATGLFGKLPAHGDFVRRGLPRSFTDPWDAWLSAGIAEARAQLGAEWDAAWDAAPVWRFRLSPGACGPDAVVGVIATCRDQVGRQFPLTLAAVLPGAATPPGDEWYETMEAAADAGSRGGLPADALVAILPDHPPDDHDATLDGRNLFWRTGLPARRMPSAMEFIELLAWPGATGTAPQARDTGFATAMRQASAPPAETTSLLPTAACPHAEVGLAAPAPGVVKAPSAEPAEPETHDADRAAAEMLALVIGTRLSEGDGPVEPPP